MISNLKFFKSEIEEGLKEVKKCKLDILILQRKNEEMCQKNNVEVERLNQVIESRLAQAEETLNKSGERKIETLAGWCSFRAMPDKWEYDDSEILDWCKKEGKPYYHTIEIVEKMKLKKDIQTGIFKKDVPGIKVTPQDPKFNYKLNAGGELL